MWEILYYLKKKKAPEGVDLIQAILLIQAQHDVLDHVQAFLLLPGETLALARVTTASSVSISSSLFIILIIIFTSRKRQTVNTWEQKNTNSRCGGLECQDLKKSEPGKNSKCAG